MFNTHEVNNHFKSALGITLILLTLPLLSIVSSWYEEVPELEEIEVKMFPGAFPDVIEISGGYFHTCAILEDSSVSCWGRNVYGGLGDGTTDNHHTPTQTSSLGTGNGQEVNNDYDNDGGTEPGELEPVDTDTDDDEINIGVVDSEDGLSSKDIYASIISLLFIVGFYYSNFSINDKKGIIAKILRTVARIRNKQRYMDRGSQIVLNIWSWIVLSVLLTTAKFTLADAIAIALTFLIAVTPLYVILLFINRGNKLMKSLSTKRQYSQVSTRYTRVVGSDTIDVFNTEQVSNLPPQAYQDKWAVIVSNGSIKIVHSIHSTKNDAVNSLLAHEINLKEKQSTSKNDETDTQALQQRNIEMARALGRTVEDIEADLADDGVLNYSAGSDVKLAQIGIESKFRKAELIGEGGMANIFRATEIDNGKSVVWKEAAGSRFNPLPEVNRRLLDESDILSNLDHPRIPKHLDYGEFKNTDGGIVGVMIMEHIEGNSLKNDIDTLLKMNRNFTLKEATKIISQICEPLEYMADLEIPIYHRDIKPANIIIEPNRGPVLIDFGLAKGVDTGTDMSLSQGMSEGWSPPERRDGVSGGFTDVFSLGQTLWNILTGERPFHALTKEEITEKLVKGNHPEWVAEVILASAQRYDRRIQSVFEFRLMLENDGKMPN